MSCLSACAAIAEIFRKNASGINGAGRDWLPVNHYFPAGEMHE
jgi:hypothetical protein